jgi:hypothetical protein
MRYALLRGKDPLGGAGLQKLDRPKQIR